jgi:hypothetical protein
MLRAVASATPLFFSADKAVCGQGPSPASQLLDDGRVTLECFDRFVAAFGDHLPDVPVWNERQSIGRLLTLSFELAGQQVVLPLKDPAQEPEGAFFTGISLHAAEQYKSSATRETLASRLLQ